MRKYIFIRVSKYWKREHTSLIVWMEEWTELYQYSKSDGLLLLTRHKIKIYILYICAYYIHTRIKYFLNIRIEIYVFVLVFIYFHTQNTYKNNKIFYLFIFFSHTRIKYIHTQIFWIYTYIRVWKYWKREDASL